MDEYGVHDTHGRAFGELLWLEIDQIQVQSPFSDLFPLEEFRIENLVDLIDRAGYDKGYPVTVWRHRGKDILIDGHHRLEAAKRSDSTGGWVFAQRHTFGDELLALEYSLAAQGQRRNMSDWDIFHAVRTMESRREHGGKRKKAGRKSKLEEISNNANNQVATLPLEKMEEQAREIQRAENERERLGHLLQISARKVQWCLTLINSGNAEELDIIKYQSLHAAYNALRKRLREERRGPADDRQLTLEGFWHYSAGQVFIKRYGQVERLVEFNTRAFPSFEDRGEFEEEVRRLMDKHLKAWTAKEVNGLEELSDHDRRSLDVADGGTVLL